MPCALVTLVLFSRESFILLYIVEQTDSRTAPHFIHLQLELEEDTV